MAAIKNLQWLTNLTLNLLIFFIRKIDQNNNVVLIIILNFFILIDSCNSWPKKLMDHLSQSVVDLKR